MTDAYSIGASLKKQQPNTPAEKFFDACAKIFGDAYDYSESVFVSRAKKIDIKCNTCGSKFSLTAQYHLTNKVGCNHCKWAEKKVAFIARANTRHNFKFDYSLVEYSGSRGDIDIICPVHGVFSQKAGQHLKYGCRKCGEENSHQRINRLNNKFKTSFADFVKVANGKHSSKYTYDESSYTAQRNKVKIHCSDHGWFELRGTAHINGAGCHTCNGRLTWEWFCTEAGKRYKGRYKYFQNRFKGVKSRVEMVCTECNTTFKQNAKTHLDTDVTPCPTCREQERREAHAKRYEARARKRHKGQFSYPEPVYDIDMGKATFHCNICDKDFIQDPRHHIKSKGCPHCMAEERRKKGGAEFIAKATELHDNLYDYSKVDFYDSDTHVAIICSVHGEFKQRPYKHLMKKGCPECGMLKSAGWTRTNYIEFCQDYADGQATLYAIRCFKADEEFLKVGITAYSVARRFKTDMPYDYTVLYEINADAGYIYDLEKRLHRILRKKEKRHTPKIPFGGYTECFTTIKPIEPLLKELTTTEQMQLIA